MQLTFPSLLIASVAMLAAAKPAPQGFNPGESKFVNAPTRQSCNDVPGGNGYYCDSAANLYYCTAGYRQLCQSCGQATNFNQPSGCTASNDGEAGNCYGTSAGAKQC